MNASTMADLFVVAAVVRFVLKHFLWLSQANSSGWFVTNHAQWQTKLTNWLQILETQNMYAHVLHIKNITKQYCC